MSRIGVCSAATASLSGNSIPQTSPPTSRKSSNSRITALLEPPPMNATLPWLETSTLRAVLLRELRGALVNRYFQVFSVLALGGGIAAVALSEAANAAAYFILQVAMYFVSL